MGTPRRWRLTWVALAVTLGLLVPSSTRAGPFDVFGFGSRSIAMGGAATATADDYTAAFHNPANLVRRKKVQLGAEVLTAFPNLTIDQTTPLRGPDPIDPDGFTGVGLGVLFPLGGKVDYRFAFGLVLYLPIEQLLRVDALDPLIPRWYLWDSLADKIQILLGIGGRITPWLALGVAVQSLASVHGDAEVGADLVNETITRRDIDVEIVNTLAPILGLDLGPWAGLSLGFSWRSELNLDFSLPIVIDLGEALDASLVTRGQSLYTPHTLSLGASFRSPDERWLVAADLSYLLWSHAPDPALFFAVDVEGEVVEGLGVGDAVDLLPGPTGLPGFSDTLNFSLGAEVRAHEHVMARLGYEYRPSPIPDQVGLTNYVDNDAHTVSVGLGLTAPDPLNLDEEPVTFEVTGAFAFLPDEATVKASPADPVGNYLAGGHVVTLSFTLRHDF